jgi:hypothetical protein
MLPLIVDKTLGHVSGNIELESALILVDQKVASGPFVRLHPQEDVDIRVLGCGFAHLIILRPCRSAAPIQYQKVTAVI